MLQPDVLEEGWASAHLRRVVADLHTDTWMLVPGSEEVIAARTGTKPGDPTGDLLFTVLMTKVLRTLHDELRKEGLAFTVPPAGAVVARVRAARPGVAEIIDTSSTMRTLRFLQISFFFQHLPKSLRVTGTPHPEKLWMV